MKEYLEKELPEEITIEIDRDERSAILLDEVEGIRCAACRREHGQDECAVRIPDVPLRALLIG